MKRNILQLELRDTFFHISNEKSKDLESLEFEERFFIVRNHFKDFLLLLNAGFDFAVWTSYTEYITEFLVRYIESAGIHLKYVKTLTDGSVYSDHSYAKRLKRILDYDVEEIISIERQMPVHENYGNVIVLQPFSGKKDDELLLLADKLISFSQIVNTRTINVDNNHKL